ncbi:hypothetical protein [Actinoallomurus iriomotensis]|uniref:Uncharacterized protein n=1 Tax=Actinoallomurus iriomotensis TaxID=478107 RepID=A0A9W6S6N4_9ACTN|nr:hypothetical protein [Actinoallomurus iriomotensis]GLY88369.1 hypothetical protein Airi02_062980 [Actinoallomurus iriomotensis]
MRKFKHKVALTLTTATILAGSVFASSPANAASSPIAACGGGSYHVIDQHALSSYGTVYLMYNGTTDCVVTWKTAYVGTPTEVQAFVERESDFKAVVDDKKYSYYAGPVKIDAPGTCIIWGGSTALPSGATASAWYDYWSHCD